jgi:hypothetical protein
MGNYDAVDPSRRPVPLRKGIRGHGSVLYPGAIAELVAAALHVGDRILHPYSPSGHAEGCGDSMVGGFERIYGLSSRRLKGGCGQNWPPHIL